MITPRAHHRALTKALRRAAQFSREIFSELEKFWVSLFPTLRTHFTLYHDRFRTIKLGIEKFQSDTQKENCNVISDITSIISRLGSNLIGTLSAILDLFGP